MRPPRSVSITVTNTNDVAPVFSSAATSSVSENQTSAYDADATDAEGDTVTYSLSGGADAALFDIDASTGEVTFKSAPDFEAPGDDDGDNVYEVEVTASDGTNDTAQSVSITVTNANDVAPAFTSGTSASVSENQTSAYDADATDAEGDSVYLHALSGGADAALFDIDASTGEVTFKSAPDFEAPGDDDGDNVYEVEVTASDGTNATAQSVSITVTNTNDVAPVFSSSATSASVSENQTSAYDADATDAEGDTVTYSLSGGADAALFDIDASTGEVTFKSAPDFEAPGDDDGDNVYEVEVTASDGTNDTAQSVSITVTNTNDVAPAFTSAAQVSLCL